MKDLCLESWLDNNFQQNQNLLICGQEFLRLCHDLLTEILRINILFNLWKRFSDILSSFINNWGNLDIFTLISPSVIVSIRWYWKLSDSTCPIGLTMILVIMSVSTFKTAVILILYKWINLTITRCLNPFNSLGCVYSQIFHSYLFKTLAVHLLQTQIWQSKQSQTWLIVQSNHNMMNSDNTYLLLSK